MAHSNLSHRRSHNLLLISKLLSQRDHTSPFTLILDTLEQTARPLLREFIRRSNISRCHTIFLAFETLRRPAGVETFIRCFGKNPNEIAHAMSTAIQTFYAKKKRELQFAKVHVEMLSDNTGFLVIIDSLMPLASESTQHQAKLSLTAYLSSILIPPKPTPQAQISLVAVYHADISIDTTLSPYSPSPRSLLSYLATTIMTVHSVRILLAEKSARDRSMTTPLFGLSEEVEGIIIGLKPTLGSPKSNSAGLVIELEHRRKSGRGVVEWYHLPSTPLWQPGIPQTFRENVILLADHPLFEKPEDEQLTDEEIVGLTFELGLTDRQRQEREGVVLPYFDAQKAGGAGEGGRILYDMGIEDDFDDEEDEI